MRTLSLRYGPVWLWFYRMDKVRKLMRILNKEDRRIVPYQIENPFVGVKLGGKAADITHRVGRACAALDGREAHKHRRFFVGIGEEVCFSDIFQALIGLEIAVRRRATRVNDAFRDALVVEMGNFFPQDKIFQQGWPARAGAQGVLVIGNTYALIGGQRMAFAAFAVRLESIQFFICIARGFETSRCSRLFARCGRAR
ncbi:hypothetical protein ENTCAN_05768 [Enterobacter cancerogenus ATCC 35316]|nr:hypothetical protein ENTCAN_05768 [Enterobacter cancerogenus ATCC 35316]